MDMEKLKQWLDLAKNMNGSDFWSGIFDQEFTKKFMDDEMFKSPFHATESAKGNSPEKTFPFIDLLEGQEEVIVLIELPGVNKENIELALSGNSLTIKGKAMPLLPQLKLSYSERFYGDFQRQITLPDPVTANEITAKFWNGILFISYRRAQIKGENIPIE